MAFPRNSLRAFLQYARKNLMEALKGARKVNIVIGNESADLDSLTSSLLYAYLKSTAPPAGAFSPIYIPLINIPSSGLGLRPEFTTVCEHAGISTSNLLHLDDIRSGFNRPENTRWILVDHNRLQGSLGQRYSQYISGVIDHHEEENSVPSATTPEPRVVEKAGSCTSLVVRYCKSTWDSIVTASLSSGAGHAQGELAINDSAFTAGWDAQVAKLALASILIDTTNLQNVNKVEKLDEQATRYLEAMIQMSVEDAKTWNRDKFYDEIDEAKRKIDDLSFEEILIKDYKEWTESGKKLGMSSIVKPLKFIVKKSAETQPLCTFQSAVKKFMAEKDLSIFAIMTAFKSTDGEFVRELLVQAQENALGSVHRFVDDHAAHLMLEQLDLDIPRVDASSEKVYMNFWIQKDLSSSRKQVAPMLREALR